VSCAAHFLFFWWHSGIRIVHQLYSLSSSVFLRDKWGRAALLTADSNTTSDSGDLVQSKNTCTSISWLSAELPLTWRISIMKQLLQELVSSSYV
jgi:hypothetical protein